MLEYIICFACCPVAVLTGIALVFSFKRNKDLMCLLDAVLLFMLSLMLLTKGLQVYSYFDEEVYLKNKIERYQKKLHDLTIKKHFGEKYEGNRP